MQAPGLLRCVLVTLCFSACHDEGPGSAQAQSAALIGRIVDEDGQPVVGAMVAFDGVAHGQSDANGTFTLPAWAAGADDVEAVLSASATDHERVTRRLSSADRRAVGAVGLRLVMRRQDPRTPIMLPEGSDAPVVVTTTRLDGSISLSVPPESLLAPNGTVARGAAEVQMSYWHPSEPLESVPGNLVGSDANRPIYGLDTFGMASVAVFQDDQELTVAPGQTVGLTFGLPSFRQAQLNITPFRPDLFWLDPTSGLWVVVARDGDTSGPMTVTYDPALGTASARVTHLSGWNMDGPVNPNIFGGCVKGRVVNACNPNQPVANSNAYVFFLDPEEITLHLAATDAAGNYCKNVGMSALYIKDDPTNAIPVPVNYFVTGGAPYSAALGQQVFDTSSMCNPVPLAYQAPSSFVCYDGGTNYRWSDYGMKGAIVNTLGIKYSSTAYYNDTCQPPTPIANLHACSFCPGTAAPGSCWYPNTPQYLNQAGGMIYYPSRTISDNCADLGTARIRPPGCSCALPNDSVPCTARQGCCPDPGGTAQFCNAQTGKCQACLMPGDLTPCQSDTACCPGAGGQPGHCSPLTGTCTACFAQPGAACSVDADCCPGPNFALHCGDGICVPSISY